MKLFETFYQTARQRVKVVAYGEASHTLINKEYKKWARRDSNPRPKDYESLSY